MWVTYDCYLKHWRRLQVAVNIHRQNDAVSEAYFVPELLYFQELPFIPGTDNKTYKILDAVALMKKNHAKWDCSEVDIFQLEIMHEINDNLW